MYGTTFSMGIHPKAARPAWHWKQVMDRASASGLEGVEIPASLLRGEDPSEIGREAERRGHFICLDTSGHDPDELGRVLELGAKVGAITVRTVIGGADFGGDRRPLAGRWNAFMEEVRKGLEQAARTADRLKVNLAVENHQDLASEDLLWLCESIGSPRFGITFDTGNPLATAEEPLEFARRVAPHVKNVHLKDYWIYWSEEGYRLVRSPIGQGVIDFPSLLAIVAEHCPVPDLPLAVELGALEARHTRVLAPDFWPDYPERSAAQFARLMRFVHAHAKPSGDWRTPYERQEPAEAVEAYEERQLAASLAYLLPLKAQLARSRS
jgi:sugar phosphate isomerase/epimerase